MTRSMTAFARQESQQSWGTLTWEVRSVNHRYLEPHLRIPEQLRELEGSLRETLRKRLSRGKVECMLRFVPEEQAQTLQVNEAFAKQLLAATEQMEQLMPVSQTLNPLDLLRWPGVLQDVQIDMDEVKREALKLFNKAMDDLHAGREREGKELALLIEQRLDAISVVVTDVRTKLPQILLNQRNMLKTRVTDLGVDLDPQRLEQEVVLLAQKADVDEEMDRLDTHVQEVRRILKQKEPVGRRLDFLMQELNREANTLSS
ncbi:YicC/YloC family endoribonuclease, partial [Neptunomonas sp.]|uniref:YicC/YloC family endoribonuclease n=1 Tax=Neptunomonas sp. TaxID=1971898 RepID=UPI0025E290F2